MKRHYVDSYLYNPTHPITVALIGVGGSGSQMLTGLARMHHALIELGHPGLMVTAFDPDEVTEANIGRQLFSSAELGLNKATALITRINRFFGTDWRAILTVFPATEKDRLTYHNIYISCVDTVSSRKAISGAFESFKKRNTYDYIPSNLAYYWMDLGNTVDSGQVVIGSLRKIKQPKSKFETVAELKTVDQLFDLDNVVETDSGPSCSLAEALSKQDLFINSTLANLALSLLWQMFRNTYITSQGCFLNLKDLNTNPINL